MKKYFTIFTISFLFCFSVYGQEKNPSQYFQKNLSEIDRQIVPVSIFNKHNIEFRLGLLSKVSVKSEVSINGGTIKNTGGGIIGSVGYTYFFRKNIGFNMSAGVMSANVDNSVSGYGTLTETAVVMPLLFGVKYLPFNFGGDNIFKPYVTGLIGPVLGVASNVRTGFITTTEAYTETALGSFAGLGADLELGKLVMVGLRTGYYFITDFKNRIGTEKNYSSPDFSFSFAFTF
jgi:outer membrane protein W